MAVASKQAQLCDKEIKWLEQELLTVNIAHAKRMEFEKVLADCRNKLGEGNQLNTLEEKLKTLDFNIANEALRQAESEISKGAHDQAAYLALENVKSNLASKSIKPAKARHEIKEIMRSLK